MYLVVFLGVPGSVSGTYSAAGVGMSLGPFGVANNGRVRGPA